VENFGLQELAKRGSLKVTRPTLFTHIADHDACMAMANHVFEKIRSGAVTIHIDQRFPLDAVAEAHRLLEGRHTTGSTILLP